MAAPACDRNEVVVYHTHWTPEIHHRAFLMTRMLVFDLLCHCTHRTQGIGVLPPDILLRILRCLVIPYM